MDKPTKVYRRSCKHCSKKFKTVYKQQWTCGSPHCKAEYQRKKRLRNKSEYLVGGRYYYYRRKVKKIDKINTATSDVKPRICLGILCDGEKEFVSNHKFNRLCDPCTVAMQNYREIT